MQNGDFELTWESNHRCRVFPVDGDAYEADVGNVFTPEKWVAWYRHGGEWAQPEVRDAWASGDPRRVQSGQKATVLFTFNKRHDAGLYQQVDVEPGMQFRLTAWAHAWSNHKDQTDDFPHPDDPRWSEGVGYDVIALPVGDYPDDTGDPQTDAIPNFTFGVGIDPTGGIDPFADTVIWGAGYHIYNGYAKQLSVEAEAEAARVTVFLRSKTRWAFKHNDAYWDSVELTISEEPTPGRGKPRVQYERTYILLPPDTSTAEAQRAMGFAQLGKRTVGSSADDAGIGDLDVRNVHAIDPDKWDGDLAAFYEQYYPGIRYVPIENGNDFQLRGRLLAADLLSLGIRLDYPTTHMPPYITDRFGVNRVTYYHNGLDLRSSYAVWGDKIKAAIGGEVIVSGYNSSEPWFGYQVRTRTTLSNGQDMLVRYAHLVAEAPPVAVGDIVGVGQILGKPDNTGESSADHLHIDVKYQGFYADPEMLIDFPEDSDEEDEDDPPPDPIPVNTVGWLGLHQQTLVVGCQEYHTLPPSVTKVFTLQDMRGMVQWTNGESVVVFRHYNNDQGQFLENPDPMAGARLWIDQFRDSLHQIVGEIYAQFPDLSPDKLVIEELNETVCSLNRESITRAAKFSEAFVLALAETGLGVRAGVFNTAVGNPHESEFDIFLPLARLAEQYGAYFGYHTYFLKHPEYGGPDHLWKYLAGRWTEMDKYFTDRGVYVKWYGGESGAVGGASGEGWVSLYPCDGWRSDRCYSGNWDQYLVDLLRLDELTDIWNRKHQNRHTGHVLFTSGASWIGWQSFMHLEPQMVALANALRNRYL